MIDMVSECAIPDPGSSFPLRFATPDRSASHAASLPGGASHASRAHRRERDHGVTDLPPFDDADLFDEAGYLRLYPGIAHAMMQGVVDTAWNHYHRHGRAEGRQPNDVDPEFYLAAYPEVERDLGHAPTVADAAPHFITLGRARGYLPNARAPRVENGAATHSPFGGFWTDHANALDLIESRLELGWLRRRDAMMLRSFALEGIVEFERPNDMERVRDASLIVDQAFTGLFPELRFAHAASVTEPEPWRPELTGQSVAALDPHMMSRKIRDLLLDKTVTDFLSLIFGARPRLTASRAFLREAMTPDRDVAWHAFSLPLQFVAVTFALEDSDDGPAFAWPGSHRLPDLLWAGEHVSLPEALRANAIDVARAIARREERVRALVHGQDPRRLKSLAGTRLIRHANLIHTVEAPDPPFQRRSLTAWYCPLHVVPCYVETTRPRMHAHNEFTYSSGVYPALDPRD